MYFIFKCMYNIMWDFCRFFIGSFSMLSYPIQLLNYFLKMECILNSNPSPLMCTIKHPILVKHLTLFGMLV